MLEDRFRDEAVTESEIEIYKMLTTLPDFSYLSRALWGHALNKSTAGNISKKNIHRSDSDIILNWNCNFVKVALRASGLRTIFDRNAQSVLSSKDSNKQNFKNMLLHAKWPLK